MKSNWKNLLLCGVMVAASALFAAEEKKSAAAARPPESVVVGKVQSIPVTVGRRYIGKVSAVEDVSLIARVNGNILEQRFSSGAFVKKGDLLFVLEDTTYKAAVDSAKAKLAQCKADLERCKAELIRLEAEYVFARKDLDRQSTLWKQKAVAETVYDEAVRKEAVAKAAVAAIKSSILAAEGAVQAAGAALVDAENNLSYTRIYAPISGKAGRALISPFNYVTPGSGELVYIANMSEMYVNVWIAMRDYAAVFGSNFERLQKEAHVRLMLADGSEFTGEKSIVFIDNKVDKDTDSIRIRVKVKNDGMMLLPDALVAVHISKKDGSKTAIPVSAISNNGQNSFVYVVGADNAVQIRPVQIGDTQGKMQIILSGLNEGETVVVDGTHKVFPGSTINPVWSK